MKSKNLLYSFKYAIEGIISAFKSERNLKIHTIITIIIVIAGIYFKLSNIEWITCVLIIALVIGSELFNTAIERMVDLLSPEIRKNAKLAKDISAGAVFIFAISAVVIGLLLFIPKIVECFF